MKRISVLSLLIFIGTLGVKGQNCVANFTTAQPNCPTVDFTDVSLAPLSTVTNWLWDFGDGTTDTVQNPSHTYLANANYPVKLVITAANGCMDSITNNVDVTCIPEPACVAAFGFIDDNCPMIIFTDSSTSLAPDSVVSWSWDFGDGGTSSAQNPIYSYPLNGDYLVSLIITSSNGCADTVSDSIFVQCLPPPDCHADFQFQVSNCSEVQFQDLSLTDDTLVGWYWNFGDGQVDSTQNPMHTYTYNGNFEVQLIVESIDGCRDTVTDSISFTCIPQGPCGADFQVNDAACPSLTFFDVSNGNDVNFWFWEFGDGSTATTQHPTHAYGANGTYQVCLTINTVDSCLSNRCKFIDVECLGLDDMDELSINLFPNPFNDQLRIDLSADLENLRYVVYNVEGRQVQSGFLDQANSHLIDTESLETGIYFFELLSQDTRILSERIIKAN